MLPIHSTPHITVAICVVNYFGITKIISILKCNNLKLGADDHELIISTLSETEMELMPTQFEGITD